MAQSQNVFSALAREGPSQGTHSLTISSKLPELYWVISPSWLEQPVGFFIKGMMCHRRMAVLSPRFSGDAFQVPWCQPTPSLPIPFRLPFFHDYCMLGMQININIGLCSTYFGEVNFLLSKLSINKFQSKYIDFAVILRDYVWPNKSLHQLST